MTTPDIIERLVDEAARERKAAGHVQGPAFVGSQWGQDIIDSHNARAKLFDEASAELSRLRAENERKDAALNVIANASERSETMFGGKMSEVTRVFEHITRVARTALEARHD